MKLYTFLLALALCSQVFAVGNPNAPKGGNFRTDLETPTTLNVLSSSDAYSTTIHLKVMDTLLSRNPDTRDFVPGLAKEWKIAKDGMSFEFTLRDGVKWHDGKPFSAEDVKFTFDAIMDKTNKYKTADKKSYYENIKSCEIIAPNTVKFTVAKQYFDNFNVVATGMFIAPMHLYKNPSKEQEKVLNKTLIGTGPFMLKEFDRAKGITLKANPDWWGRKEPALQGKYNFDTITFRFISESDVAIQRIENGDLDFIGLGPDDYVKKTSGPKWGKDVLKVKTANKAPRGYGFIGFNLTNPMFSSKKTRIALSHLMNRREMIKKFLYGFSEPATGPEYKQSEFADPTVKPIEYDPKEALKLLKEDGWSSAPGETVLSKTVGGKKIPLSFTILNPAKDYEKYLTIFKEDAKKAGVNIDIKLVEWNAFLKLVNEHKFETVILGWTPGPSDFDWDPKQVWHSDSIANEGSNFISYKNPEVDKLIDEARVILDRGERVKKLRKVYRMIAEDAPYIFLFNSVNIFYGHSKNMKREKDTYTYEVGTNYWWMTKP